MKNRILLVFSILTLLASFQEVRSQVPCGFDHKHQQLLDTDPLFAKQVEENNRSIQNYINAHPNLKNPVAGRPMAVYTIPVVVHVMHTGGAIGTTYNPTDAQIIGAINYLNQVFAGSYSGMTAASPGGAAGDMEIRFALAQRTPTCGATNGIDRVDASSLPFYVANGVNSSNTNGTPEIDVKNLSRWNPADYYNIWIVNKIDSKDGTSGQFTAGYAYFPSSPSYLDGTIMLATQMVSGEKTLPHEIGHALDLYHTFHGSSNSTQYPPYTTNPTCFSDGDLCCDTDPVSNNNVAGVYNFSCRTGPNPATANTTNYSINTESNFMAYTNCYTLFTNHQKARVQAAMSLASRASLVAPGNLALTPCGSPVVNFDMASNTRPEYTITTSGCNTYTDYTYKMVIGQAPSATTTATLTYSGSAVKGVDYDITTNGNFVTPSDVITFPALSTSSQAFTIRVYDDKNPETAETLVIDFTVNNGGGDAIKGTQASSFTLNLFDNDIAPSGNNTGTSTYSNTYAGNILTQSCFRSSKIKHRTQYMITKAELNAMGITSSANLNSLRFRVVTKQSTKAYAGFTVAMMNTTSTDLSFGFEPGTYTQVYSNNYTTATGDNTITFTTPFLWDGSSNVIVNLCFENASADAADDVMEAALMPAIYTTYANYTAGATAGCSLGATFVHTARPRMLFTYALIPTAIETAAGANTSIRIVAGSNDYFYSNNNKLLMKLSGINAALGCVSSSLDAGGNSWVSFMGGTRSAKIFAVTPTTNAGTAGYTIDLYFDNAELDSKPAAGLKLAKTTASTIAGANASNTVIVPATITTLGTGTTIYSASFTGFSRFFLVDASVSLPVELINFEATLTNEQTTLLKWATSSEQNNKQFDIETSTDGINFFTAGTVASQGNSTTTQNYQFLHLNPVGGNNWYRLKQTDWDGKSTYSKIILVKVPLNEINPTIYPIPAQTSVTLNFGSLISKGRIEILSADLKVVRKENITTLSSKREINISHLAKGVYFVRITVNNTNKTVRFIKQ